MIFITTFPANHIIDFLNHRKISTDQILTTEDLQERLFNALNDFQPLHKLVNITMGKAMKIPAINIGNRQQGRERVKNVIDVCHEKNAIVSALNKALQDEDFLNKLKMIENPYGDGKSAEKIVEILKTVSLNNLIQKQFVD